MASKVAPEPTPAQNSSQDVAEAAPAPAPVMRIKRHNSEEFITERNSFRQSQSSSNTEGSKALDGLTGRRSNLKSTAWVDAQSRPTDLTELRQRYEWVQHARKNRLRVLLYGSFSGLMESFDDFRGRNYMIDPSSNALLVWDWSMAALAIYSAISVPLYIVFTETRWPGFACFDFVVDCFFMIVSPRPPPARGGTHTKCCHRGWPTQSILKFRVRLCARRMCACAFAPPRHADRPPVPRAVSCSAVRSHSCSPCSCRAPGGEGRLPGPRCR